jgi:hypothetical protein
MDLETLRIRWTYPDRYDNCPASDARGRLEPASLDDRGASLLRVPQTTYRGFVTQLQTDLARFGFDPGPLSGFFGPDTELAVRAFQEAALICTHRPGGRTFSGGISGIVDDATRAEISIWRQRAFRRHEVFLDATREEQLLCEVAHALWGPAAFSRVSHDPAGGLRFGLLGFSQRSGALGRLVWRLWATSPRSFRWVFGRHGEEELVAALTSPDPAVRMSLDLSAGDWTKRFAAAGEVDFWQREQLRLAREGALRPVVRLAGAARLRWERALAVLLLVFLEAGGEPAVRLALALGPRPPGVPVVTHVARAPALLAGMGEAFQGPSRHVSALLEASSFDDCAWLLA